MKHLQSHSAFITENLVPIGKTVLYRGDSNKVLKFTWRRFDVKWAFFGPGLYLTDDPVIADSYTLKGADETGSNILASFSIFQPKKNLALLKVETVLNAIIPQTHKKINFEQPHYQKNSLFDKSKKDNINTYPMSYENAASIFAGILSPGGLPTKTAVQLARQHVRDSVSIEDKAMKKMFSDALCGYYQEIIDYFNPKYREALAAYETEWKHKIRYITQKVDDQVETVVVIDKSKQGGHVSNFEVDTDYLSKCLNGTTTVKGTKPFGLVIASFKKHYIEQTSRLDAAYKKEKYFYDWKHYQEQIKWQMTGRYAIHDFLHHLIPGIAKLPLEQGQLFWIRVIKDLKAAGYTGWVYEGGRNMGTNPHLAYCLWDLSKVKRLDDE